MRSFINILFLILSYSAFAQDSKFGIINSGEVIRKGINLHDNKDYTNAIKEFRTVPENDTNYILALYEIALSARVDSQYSVAIETASTAIKKGAKAYDHDMYLMLGGAYDESNKYDSAYFVFKLAQKKYPNSYRVIHALGINKFLQKQYDSAFAYFTQALMINPYAAASHYYLGQLAYELGYPIQAALSYCMSLACSPDGNRSGPSMNKLYLIANVAEDIRVARENRKEWIFLGENYNELEAFWKSKVAQDKKYKIQTDLDELTFRQINLIFDKIEVSGNEAHFWSKFYTPLYKQIFNDKMFNGFCLRMVEGIKSDNVQKKIKSESKSIKEATDLITSYLNNIGFQRGFAKNPDKGQVGYFFENGKCVAKGISHTGKAEDMQGEWEVYNEVGNIFREAKYKNGKAEGPNKSFYLNGNVREEFTALNDKIDGVYKSYYENGVLKLEGNYIEGAKDGIHKEYFLNGNQSSEEMYSKGKKNGPAKLFYNSGLLQYELNYVNDLIEGDLKEYHKSGKLLATTKVISNKAQGEYTSYHWNGQINTKGNMKDGDRDGEFIEYSHDGKLVSKKNYKEGKQHGSAVYYHPNGKESQIGNFEKGNQEGTFTEYNDEGKVETIIEYKKGRIQKTQYFNILTGAKVSESILSDKNKNTIRIYNTTGQFVTEAIADREGNFNGTYIKHYANGKVSATTQYENGKEYGLGNQFYKNGNPKRIYTHKEDELDGLYKTYFYNGTLASEGYYMNGKQQGYWYTYNENGVMTEKEYYLNDALHGSQFYYHGNGKISKETRFEKGIELMIITYDTMGRIISEIATPPRKESKIIELGPTGKNYRSFKFVNNYLQGPMKYFYPNGTTQIESNYISGNLHGDYVVYFPNGKTKATGAYVNGERHGTWKYFNHNGKLTHIYHYNQGEKEGIDSLFYEQTGTIEAAIPYTDDDKHGWLHRFAPTGELAYKYHYVHGLLVGYTYELADGGFAPEITIENSDKAVNIKALYKNGKTSSEAVYQNGDYHGKRKLYHPNGQLLYECDYIDGYVHGSEKEYHSNGTLYTEAVRNYDELNGTFKKYNDKGVLLAEENYVNGEDHGKSMYYNDNGTKLFTIINYWNYEIDVN